jgi:hypothetical protein
VPGRDDPNRLGGLGAVVWELLDHPLLEAELDEAVEAIVGSRTGVAECLVEMLTTELIVPLPDG